jgi:C4-dicarboxylate transporter DctM subunit
MMTAILFGTFAVLCLVGVPIAFVLGLASILAFLYDGGYPLTLVVQRMFTALDGFPLMAIPFFIFAGGLMDIGGISRRIVNFAYIFVGTIRGGLAMVGVIGSAIFAGVSGSAVADTAAMGTILIPRMIEKGYTRSFSAGLIASAGTLGPLIPPSIPMIVYGVIAGASIGQLFIAGVVPGLIAACALMATSWVIARKKGFPAEERITLREAWVKIKDAIWAVVMPVVVLGGIRFGIFTPTEAGVIACVYGFVVGFFIYREIRLADIPKVLREGIVGTTVVMFLIATASLFSWILASEQVPQAVAAFFLSISHDPKVVFLLINIMLLVIGTFMDCNPALIMTMPVFLPLVTELGIDLIHFGVVAIFNLLIGLLTPPVGACLFVACNIAKAGMTEVTKGVWPFIVVMVALLMVFTYCPGLVLWLPNAMR